MIIGEMFGEMDDRLPVHGWRVTLFALGRTEVVAVREFDDHRAAQTFAHQAIAYDSRIEPLRIYMIEEEP